MKRILVIDESEVVRETLGLILGREFAVTKRPPSTSLESSLADAKDEVDSGGRAPVARASGEPGEIRRSVAVRRTLSRRFQDFRSFVARR